MGKAHFGIYITGYTSSTNFPTTSGAYDTSYNSGAYDVFVSKLDGGLANLVASTYLGGDDTDGGNSIAFQAPPGTSYVHITGVTESSNFPVTSGAYDTSFNGGTYGDVFVSKFDSGLTSLLASTFVGGSNSESGLSLVHDSSGNVYVTGQTDSSDFPTTSGACDTTKGTAEDVFVSKLNNGLTSLSASTFLGGGSSDFGVDIALDSNEDVYVTGNTSSSNFPTTGGAYDTSYGGGNSDAFISKLNNVLTGLYASTYLGHESADEGASLAFGVDASGYILVYVTGRTNSPSFPTTTGAYDTSHNGLYDAFISRLNSSLSTLQASTFLGGTEREWSQSIAINSNGRVFVTGYTNSSDFPTVSGSYDTSYNGDPRDAFISKLDSDLSN